MNISILQTMRKGNGKCSRNGTWQNANGQNWQSANLELPHMIIYVRYFSIVMQIHN